MSEMVIVLVRYKIYFFSNFREYPITNYGSIERGNVMKNLILALLVLTFTVNVKAEVLSNDEIKRLTIDHVEVTPVNTEAFMLDRVYVELPKAPTNPIDEISIILDGLIAIGKKIWPIIEAGRPVINNKLAPAVSIIPQLEKPTTGVLYEMENWSVPKAQSFRVSYKNMLGMEVVGFTYTVMFQYNGAYKGNGKYVTSFKVLASNIYCAWGFDFDASSELISIANVGTSMDPVASGIVGINYAIKGKLNEQRNASSVYVDGLGRMQVVSQ